MSKSISVPSVSVIYAQDGSSTRANALGMRPMQERAYLNRELKSADNDSRLRWRSRSAPFPHGGKHCVWRQSTMEANREALIHQSSPSLVCLGFRAAAVAAWTPFASRRASARTTFNSSS